MRYFIRKPELLTALGLPASTIDRLEARGEFPRRRLLADRTIGWLASEIDDWAKNRPVSDLPPVPRAAPRQPDAGSEVAA